MQNSIVFIMFLAVSSVCSIPLYAVYPRVISRSSLITPTQQQYHNQDDLGHYAYGYSEPNSAKQEVRSIDGITRGSYSYYDSEGKLQTVDYTADEEGFRVAATNLPRAPTAAASSEHQPIPVADTDAVAAARATHLAAHKAANSHIAKSESDSVLVNEVNSDVKSLPTLQDTEEVTAAKVEHLNRVEHEKQRNEILSNTGLIYGTPVVYKTAPVVYNSAPLVYKSAIYPGIYSYPSYPFNSRFLASSYTF